jgi:hypothetical protein
VTFVGRKHLSEDGLLTTSPYQRVTGRLTYSWPSNWSAFGQFTWYPGDRTSEMAMNFGPGVGSTSANVYTAPQPGFTLQAGLIYRLPTVGVAMLSSTHPVTR